jgi:hypothetical protein
MSSAFKNALASVATVGTTLLLAAACASNALEPSTFTSPDASATCNGPVEALPATVPSGTVLRAITFHVTNDSGQTRWVQTTADDGCAAFDIVRGGAPFALAAPFTCGCQCTAPAPRVGFARLAPGEAVDLHWDGLVYQLSSACVTGPAFGCLDNEYREIPTATAFAARPTRYDGVLHVESIEPPAAFADRCAHGTGEARFALTLGTDLAPQTIPVSLK